LTGLHGPLRLDRVDGQLGRPEPTAAALRLHIGPVTLTVELADHAGGASIEIDVVPSKPEDLALAEPGPDGEGVQRSGRVGGDRVEEAVDLGRRPRVDRVEAAAAILETKGWPKTEDREALIKQLADNVK
jgi:hypothetical protein